MNKAEFIDALAAKTGLSKKDAKVAIDGTLEVITEALVKKDSVAFTGFGTFAVTEREARDGRNPKTGATIKIEATSSAKFKVGKALKDAVKGK